MCGCFLLWRNGQRGGRCDGGEGCSADGEELPTCQLVIFMMESGIGEKEGEKQTQSPTKCSNGITLIKLKEYYSQKEYKINHVAQ